MPATHLADRGIPRFWWQRQGAFKKSSIGSPNSHLWRRLFRRRIAGIVRSAAFRGRPLGSSLQHDRCCTHCDASYLKLGGAVHIEKRILVTGGAGFLGSHLCSRLLEEGNHVICVDNFFSSSRSNIEHLLGHRHFELIRHDVCFPLYVEVDEIYNLACPASPIHYQRDPVQTTKTSVIGAINMLGLAKRLKGKILQASTSEIYGDPSVHPQNEEYWGNVNPIGFRSCYDESKRCAETLFFDYRRQHNLEIKVARIFNTYGPRMHAHDGRVVSTFVVQALLGRDI